MLLLQFKCTRDDVGKAGWSFIWSNKGSWQSEQRRVGKKVPKTPEQKQKNIIWQLLLCGSSKVAESKCLSCSLRLSLQLGLKAPFEGQIAPGSPWDRTGRWERHRLHRGTCGARLGLGPDLKTVPLQATPNELGRHIGRTIAKCNHQNWILRGERWAAPRFEWLPAQSGGGGLGRDFFGGGGALQTCAGCSSASWWRGGIELEDNILAHVTTKVGFISFYKTFVAFFNVTVATRLKIIHTANHSLVL